MSPQVKVHLCPRLTNLLKKRRDLKVRTQKVQTICSPQSKNSLTVNKHISTRCIIILVTAGRVQAEIAFVFGVRKVHLILSKPFEIGLALPSPQMAARMLGLAF